MANSRQIFWPLLCLAGLLATASIQARDQECLAGPAYAKFDLTLDSGWRKEAAGPLFYEQVANGQKQWAFPPFFCRTATPDVDWNEWDLFIRLLTTDGLARSTGSNLPSY